MHFGCVHNHSPGELLLCTHCHVDEIFLSAITLSLARQCYAIYSLSHDCRFSIAGNFVCLDIVWFQDACKLYLCQAAFLHHFLVQDDGSTWIPVNCRISSGLVLMLVLQKHGIGFLWNYWTWIVCFGTPLLACSIVQDRV